MYYKQKILLIYNWLINIWWDLINKNIYFYFNNNFIIKYLILINRNNLKFEMMNINS